MAIEDDGYRDRFLLRDRDSKCPNRVDTILADAGIPPTETRPEYLL